MKFTELYPFSETDSPEQIIGGLARSILVKTNFMTNVRYALGWRGIKPVSASTECWTAKIGERAGVFAFWLIHTKRSGDFLEGVWQLYYFPDHDDPLVEVSPMENILKMQRPDYLETVREFNQEPDFHPSFSIGQWHCFLDIRQSRFSVILEAPTHIRSIAREGIFSQGDDGEPLLLVEPGGVDGDFPAWTLAEELTDVFLASIAYFSGEIPKLLRLAESRGFRMEYGGDSPDEAVPDSEIIRRWLEFGYPEALSKIVREKVWPKLQWNELSRNDARLALKRIWKNYTTKSGVSLDKQSLGIEDRPQFIILTGFLGSGKTSFLQRFVEYETGRNRYVAIIQNEIGASGLDGQLMESGFTLLEMDEGCVCCTLSGQLRKGIREILSHFQPDVIVLETTGLANPFNLLDEVAGLEDLVRFDSVTTVVDPLNLELALEMSHLAEDQIKAADILLVNKADLASPERLSKMKRKLRAINGKALYFETHYGDINPGLLYDGSGKTEYEVEDSQLHCSHETDHIGSRKIILENAVRQQDILNLLASSPAEIFRIKGAVRLKEETKPVAVQYVAGRFELEKMDEGQYFEPFLVGIGPESALNNFENHFSRISNK
jgi:G3E family GTPase